MSEKFDSGFQSGCGAGVGFVVAIIIANLFILFVCCGGFAMLGK